MPSEYEIRANFDRETIVVYQAYPSAIADPALGAQRFVSPFSFQRMTWIKPSFLWLMHRSNWGRKSGQDRILAVRITRKGWESALSRAVLTSFEPSLYSSPEKWREDFSGAQVHVQWDPERSLRGAALLHRSIQVGLSRHIVREFVDQWIVRIEDSTPRVRKISSLLESGQADKAQRQLPDERVYPLDPELSRRILITSAHRPTA
jgi:hypothetical protein